MLLGSVWRIGSNSGTAVVDSQGTHLLRLEVCSQVTASCPQTEAVV